MNKDLFGKALLDYQSGNYSEDIITWTNISDEDKLPLPYLFRGYSEMPKLEQKALQLAKLQLIDKNYSFPKLWSSFILIGR